jgi:hypothetical protein
MRVVLLLTHPTQSFAEGFRRAAQSALTLEQAAFAISAERASGSMSCP